MSRFAMWRAGRQTVPCGAAALFACCQLLGLSCHAEPDQRGTAPATGPRPTPKPAAVPTPPCAADQDPPLTEPFSDGFERPELGADWHSTSYGAYYLKGGKLCISKPRNHPLWLRRKLPVNVRVSFDATPLTTAGDIKAELFGDGCAFDVAGRDYTATSYVAVLGAHNNAEHWLARLYEHAPENKRSVLVAGAPTIATGKLVQNKTYHVEFSRTDGREVKFSVDGVLVHNFEDNTPLTGKGHDHFAFNGWENSACFDQLTVEPLP